MSAFEPDYTATTWDEKHHYRLADGQLDYRFGDSDTISSIDLRGSNFSLKPLRQTHRYFRAGLTALAFPMVTLGVIYAKEHSISGLGAIFFVQMGFFVTGLYFAARYRQSYRGRLLQTAAGEALLIYQDPAHIDEADTFIERLRLQATDVH